MDFPCSNTLCLQVALDACALRPQSLDGVGRLLDALQITGANLLYSLAKQSNSGVEKRQVAVAVILKSLKNRILGGDSCMGLCVHVCFFWENLKIQSFILRFSIKICNFGSIPQYPKHPFCDWIDHFNVLGHDNLLSRSCQAISPSHSRSGPIFTSFYGWMSQSSTLTATKTAEGGCTCRLVISEGCEGSCSCFSTCVSCNSELE